MLHLTRAQVREVDRRCIEEYKIPGIVLMENAARSVADEIHDVFRVLIVCGPGNNGGDGLALARHLHNRSMQPQILFACDPDDYKGDAKTNYEIARKMKLPMFREWPTDPTPLIVDAIFGTGLTRPPTDLHAFFIERINRSGRPILSIDIPSGLDCDTGKPLGVCVRATRTVTFVAEKMGFACEESKKFTGQVIVADIGCPCELIQQV